MAERTLDTPSFVPNGTDLCDCDASNPDGQDEEILSTDRQVKTFRGRGPRDCPRSRAADIVLLSEFSLAGTM